MTIRGNDMGLFGFGKKKTETLYSPVLGELKELRNVSDPMFAQGVMGQGFGVVPLDEKIYSPVEGTIESVFKTKHALGIKTKSGLEVMVHMGIDTVELKGAPFNILIKEGDKVKSHTPIAIMDLDMIKDAGKDPVILTIVTNTTDMLEKSELASKDSSKITDVTEAMIVTLN